MHNASDPAALSRRERFLIFGCISLVTILAWAYLVHVRRQMSADMEHDQMMAAMGMTMNTPWSAADALLTFAMWAIMMVGMMAPSASPMLLLFAATRAGRRDGGAPLATFAFSSGYIAVWTAFSLAATAAQYGLHQAAMLSPAMASSSSYLTAAILIGAGIYQLTPWKGRCLTRCRSPLGFLIANWRDGTSGALRMGIRHGCYCLGCCWGLMCVLFVVGVMNLAWVAALSAFVWIEKIGPVGPAVARIAGVAMIIAGLGAIV